MPVANDTKPRSALSVKKTWAKQNCDAAHSHLTAFEYPLSSPLGCTEMLLPQTPFPHKTGYLVAFKPQKMEVVPALPRQSIDEFINNLATMSRAQRELRRRATSIADANRIQEITSSTPQRSIKRPRTSASPISIASTPPRRAPRKVKSERDKLFDAIEAGADYPLEPAPIRSADDLNEAQLKKCYEILHACGSATDPNASLSKTRQSIDGFLDAVFNDWSSRKAGALLRSELDFLVDAEVVAGRLCGKPQEHTKLTDCAACSLCAVNVSAVATYCNNPPMFKLEFSTIDELSGQPEAFCPISRKDIRWVEDDWVQELRQSLRTKVIAKIHKHNKHLAIWQARKLIIEWAKGSLSLGENVKKMGFLERETADVAIVGLGGTMENK